MSYTVALFEEREGRGPRLLGRSSDPDLIQLVSQRFRSLRLLEIEHLPKAAKSPLGLAKSLSPNDRDPEDHGEA